MSKPTKGRGSPHFLPIVCEQACGCLSEAYASIEKGSLDRRNLPSFRSGPFPSQVLASAWHRFQRQFIRDGRLISQPVREIDEKGFRHILEVHWEQYSKTRTCPRPTRRKEVNLTVDEARELAVIAATPKKDEAGQYIRYDTLDLVKQDSPRAKQLIEKSGATTTKLHKHLLQNVKDLGYSKEDIVPTLCPSTRKRRIEVAAILRGEKPWFKRQRIHGTRGGDKVPVMWNQDWWLPHTFVLDATHFTNLQDVGPPDRLVYTMKGLEHQFPPREMDRPSSIHQDTSLMIYSVFHAYLGCVVGPDLMFTGTKLPAGEGTREQKFQKHHLKSWHDTLLKH